MLKPSHRVFVESYIQNGGNAVQAARVAFPGLTYGSLRVKAHRLLTSANILIEIEALLRSGGISDEFLAGRLRQIIERPKESDGISIAGINLVGKWKGYSQPKKEFELPPCPISTDELDTMLIRMRRLTGT